MTDESKAAQLATCTWDKKWQSLWNCRSPPLHDPDKNALNEITESAKILCAASSEAAEIATCAFEKWQNLRNCTHVFLQWQFDRIEQHHCSVGARYKISWNHGSVWWTNHSTSLLHSPSIHKLHLVSLGTCKAWNKQAGSSSFCWPNDWVLFHSIGLLLFMILTKMHWMRSQSQPKFCAQPLLKQQKLQLALLIKWQNLRNCMHLFLQWQFDRIEQHHCSMGARYKINWNYVSILWANQSTLLVHSPSIHKLHLV